MSRESASKQLGLPIRPFLYTLDQIADLTSLTLSNLKTNYIYYDGVHSGRKPQKRIMARNIAPVDGAQEWRVTEVELIRWLRVNGFRVYERSSATR